MSLNKTDDKAEPRHIITSSQFDKEFLKNIFALADDIDKRSFLYESSLKRKKIVMFFSEPSTRTWTSFMSAIFDLGGYAIPIWGEDNSSERKGESLRDTIKTFSRLADAVVMRHKANDSAIVAAEVATIPIINAGMGQVEHPTQGMLDMYTINEIYGRFDNFEAAFVGDLKYGRANHSLINMLASFGNQKMHFVSSPELALPEEYKNRIAATGVQFTEHYNLDSLPRNLDFIYQTRLQKERLNGENSCGAEFVIDKRILDTFSKNTLLLHPLPRNEEIATCVDNDPRAVYFDQVENGLLTRRALLHYVFHGM